MYWRIGHPSTEEKRNPIRHGEPEGGASGASDYAITRRHIFTSSCHHTSLKHARRSPCGHHECVELGSRKCDTYGGARHPKTSASFRKGDTAKAFKPWHDDGRENIVSASELKEWVEGHCNGASFGQSEMRSYLEDQCAGEVGDTTVATYLAHAMVYCDAVTENAKYKQAARITAEQSMRRVQAFVVTVLATHILSGRSPFHPPPPKVRVWVCVCVCVCTRLSAVVCVTNLAL